MNKFIYFFILLNYCLQGVCGQNLVPNPSFEEKTVWCPVNISNMYVDNSGHYAYVKNWMQPSNGTSDYYNECSYTDNSVPENYAGFQYARTGHAYCGILVRDAKCHNYREYIQAQLVSPLNAGETYLIKFYVSFAGIINPPPVYQGCFRTFYTDDIGAQLSVGRFLLDTSVAGGCNSASPTTFSIRNPEGHYLNDTALWMEIADTFTAAGGEDWITIGNFLDDEHTDSVMFYSFCSTVFLDCSYYLIDDVSIERWRPNGPIDTLPSCKLVYPDAFTPNGDGINDGFRGFAEAGCEPESYDLRIYNRWGETVFESNNFTEEWRGTFKNTEQNGDVYLYYATAKLSYLTDEQTYIGYVHLIR